MVLHPECADSIQEDCRGQMVTSSPTTVNTNPSIFLSRTPSKKEQKKIFASPMLQWSMELTHYEREKDKFKFKSETNQRYEISALSTKL